MGHEPLTVPEKSALLVLMLIGGEVANSDIQDNYRFTIDKKVRETLAKRDLIQITKHTRPRIHYTHILTEAGWECGRDELGAPLPDRADKSFRVLHGVLGALDAHLARSKADLRTFLHPSEVVRESAEGVAEWIESAYDSLVARPGGWVSLTRLRGVLSRIPRDTLDDALRRLARNPNVFLIPEANQKILTAEDRTAAIELGGEAKHLLSIERP
jgi:hypothetical protein